MVVRLSYVVATSLLLASLPLAAHAQERSDADLAAALARVPPGSTIRVQTFAGAVLEGTLQLAGERLRLDTADGLETLAMADVRSAWLRERRTRTGAIIGALLGGAGGGAFLGFLGLVADVEEAGRLAVVGVLAGAGAGGLLGGVVGAAVPRWTLIHPTDSGDIAVPTRSAPGGGRRRLGAFEASAGFGRIGGDEPTDGGPGGRLGLHAEFGADAAPSSDPSLFFSVGPEIGWFDLGSSGLVRREFITSSSTVAADTLEFSRSYTAFTAGGLLRLGLATGRVRGYGLAGLAYNRWEFEQRDERWLGPGPEPPAFASGNGRFEHLGYTIGAGLQATVGRAIAMTLDLRRTSGGACDMDLPGHYWTITLGASRRW